MSLTSSFRVFYFFGEIPLPQSFTRSWEEEMFEVQDNGRSGRLEGWLVFSPLNYKAKWQKLLCPEQCSPPSEWTLSRHSNSPLCGAVPSPALTILTYHWWWERERERERAPIFLIEMNDKVRNVCRCQMTDGAPVVRRVEVWWFYFPCWCRPGLLWSLQFQYAVTEIRSQPVMEGCRLSFRCRNKQMNIIRTL